MALQVLEVRIIRRTLQEMTLRKRESAKEKELEQTDKVVVTNKIKQQ